MAKSTATKKQTETKKKKPAAKKTSEGSASGWITDKTKTLQKTLRPKLKGTPWLETIVMDYLEVLKKYFVIEGRARRKEFWMFVLCNLVISVPFAILGMIPIIGFLFRIVSTVYSLAVFIPGITVGIRRLHDTNRTGWTLMLYLTLLAGPIIIVLMVFSTLSLGLGLLFALFSLAGPIIIIVFWALAGTSGRNKYGNDPKA